MSPRKRQGLAGLAGCAGLAGWVQPLTGLTGKTGITGLTLLTTVFLFLAVSAHAVPAFPTAEGFGANSIGGRGGRVIEVTHLNDSGTGSLRACMEATGPRICVFRVSGTIQLSTTSPIRLAAAQSYLTVAGQTAPGGIQIKGNGFMLTGGVHDVILRHLRIRPGYSGNGDVDGITLWGNGGRVYNILIDHCSIQWSTDELLSVTNYVTDTTLQWLILAEGANPWKKGTLIKYDPRITLTIHHSLYAHNSERNPAGVQGLLDFRNNVVYNWLNNNATLWGSTTEGDPGFTGNFVNNQYITGPNSVGSPWIVLMASGGFGTRIYTTGNRSNQCPSGCSNDWDNGFRDLDLSGEVRASEAKYRVATPYTAPPVTTASAGTLKTLAHLQKLGANRPRDAVDTRIINEVLNGTGNQNTIQDGGPWPDLASGAPAPPVDSDHDGMPDSWESSHGLNPNSASDGPATASNGYTNVENYLNELAGDLSVPPTGAPCDQNSDGSITVTDVQLCANQAIGASACTSAGDINKDSMCNVIDVQRVVNTVLGGACVTD